MNKMLVGRWRSGSRGQIVIPSRRDGDWEEASSKTGTVVEAVPCACNVFGSNKVRSISDACGRHQGFSAAPKGELYS
uniref:Uncharacterized protein n=1 Tax=Panagrellus redivivus TaxID=6233 RepID=A0A7E4WBW9_PANRE